MLDLKRWIAVVMVWVGAVMAVPLRIDARAVSSDIYNKLKFMEQYAAAAYCPGNNNQTGAKITCSAGNCPDVQAANATSVSEFENSLATDVTGFVATDTTNSLIIIAFRGSESLRNYLTDIEFPVVATTICADCLASTGFYTSWNEAKTGVLAAVTSARTQYPSYQVVVTGHSLGGAIASFAAAELRGAGVDAELYTYGSPRIGLAAIATYITNQTTTGNYRVTHYNDIVPKLPPTAIGYAHISPEYYIDVMNNVPVTAESITRFDGINETMGNAGTSDSDVNAHRWYFNNISACYPHGDGIELKRGVDLSEGVEAEVVV